MSGLTEDRLRVVAIIHALKAVGIRVKNWKNFLNGDSNCQHTFSQESAAQRLAFGRDLHLLPQHQLSDMGGPVPQFLVEACGYLSQHLDTEGLFRKTGSLSRIRALRADLEQGKPVFLPLHAALLQPCDVASLIKQFLRELPSPLIPTDLQIPLIQAQGLEMTRDQEGARNRTTLLITALFPSSHARALRYLCTFLRHAAERCSENRMDASSLAVVIAPNLLQCPPCKLTLDTEKHLDQQTSVIKSLILHADHIGVVPSCMLEALKATVGTETPSPAGGAMFSKRTGLSVYRSLRRQRRRSVGEIFVDAFSKLKPCRTPTGPPVVLDVTSVTPLSKSPTPQSPVTVKRKAIEESLPELEGSAKKRRSLHDLREDMPTTITQAEVTPTHKEPENCLEEHQEQSDCKSDSPLINNDVSPRIPLILIDGPGGVVGNEVDDDPDLLNCSFVESPNDCLIMGSKASCIQRQDRETEPCDDECWTVLEDVNFEPLGECEVIQSVAQNEWSQVDASTEVENEPEVKQPEMLPCKASKKDKSSSKNRSRPRRSISLPEVTLESCTDVMPDLEKEVGRAETEMDNNVWPMFASLTLSNEQESVTTEKKVGINEAQETKGSIKTQKNYKQDKIADSTLGFKRPHQRLSVAERLRGFSALTLLLRTSRAAPQFREKPQESLQRGATRLRRQGARRFGRSISHEGVSERPPEQSPVGSPPANQAFIDICDASPDSGVESVDHEPINDLHQEMCKRSQSSPQKQTTDDVDSLSSLGNPNQDLVLSAVEKTEIHFLCKQTEQNVEELDLHKLLDQKCHIGGHEENDHQDSNVSPVVLTPDLASPMFFQQMVPLNLFEDTSSVEDFRTDQVSPLHESNKETLSWLNATPTIEFPPFASLTRDGVISEDDTSNRLPCDLSPSTFQFRRQITRRHYRDSPRWPSHEVRMSAWNPLPL
ncbi:Rho GTPase-activating protein 11A [Anabarilius grahami]|uniref:Rho GTPase-activating protein 11A n=1 Tax=Anabarilius grahami TaxID=495550 RepID=A0A3N0Z7N9_ANAGA|nr:Rho GTPase-activating protein 11A [Anabarilius grahami]